MGELNKILWIILSPPLLEIYSFFHIANLLWNISSTLFQAAIDL